VPADMALDTTTNLMDFGAAIADFAVAPIVPAAKLLRLVKEQSRRIPALDRFWDNFQQDLPARLRPDADLDFLSKVSRVAELRDSGA
jgi:hypothetical protein